MKWIYLLTLFISSSCLAVAQEVLVPLKSNYILRNKHSANTSRISALTLPFADDFNQSDVYPDASRWMDKNVFINNTFSVLPPSVGVATFDGLDENGQPYNSNPQSSGIADILTSNTIDLSGLAESDKVYLSFYWQAGGLGDRPDVGDYLAVEFLNQSGDWVEQTRINAPDSVNAFVQEFVPVLSDFLYDGFAFRFVAKGSLAGSADIWNLDYILLDKNRTPALETSVSDLAFIQGNGKYLKRYYQMPFRHFTADMLKDSLLVTVKNNFLNTVDIVDNFEAKNLSDGTVLGIENGQSQDILSGQTMMFPYPKVNLSGIPSSDDTVQIEYHYSFQTSAENAKPSYVRANNDLRERLMFANVFAYDDGTAERAYRMVNYDFAKVAVKYTATVPDTLRAIRIFFPDFPNFTSSVTDPYFNIVVYQGLDTIQGENDSILYREEFVQKANFHVPVGETFNGFGYYTFKPELNDGKDYLLVNGDFYIGIEYEKNNDVDVGFDMNNQSPENMFYNVGLGWRNTQFPGSIMMNAVMGKKLSGIYTSVVSHRVKDIQVYPNPARDFLYLDITPDESYHYAIYNMTGSLMHAGMMNRLMKIGVGQLSSGLYILQLSDKDSVTIGTAKFIVP